MHCIHASQTKPPSWPAYAALRMADLQDRPSGAMRQARADAGMVAIVNGRGERELFVTGPDGRIANHHPDSSSETGFRAADTGLSGKAVAAGLDADGRIVLFAAQGLQLAYVSERNQPGTQHGIQPGPRWSAPAVCTLALPAGALALEAVVTATIGGQLLVAVLVAAPATSRTTGILRHMAWCVWPGAEGSPQMQASSLATAARHHAWTGASLADAALTAFDTEIVSYGIADGRVTRCAIAPFAAHGSIASIASIADASGQTRIVAILEDGRLYRLACGGGAYQWQALDLQQSCRQLALARDGDGAIHVFALGEDKRLWHLAPSSFAPDGFLPAVPVLANVLRFGLVEGRQSLDLFIVGSASNAVAPALHAMPPGADEDARSHPNEPFADLYSKDNVATIRGRIDRKTREAFELATMEWLAWFHPERVLQPFGHLAHQ